MNKETIAMAIVAIIVFTGVIYLATQHGNETTQDGVRVIGKVADMRATLNNSKILLQINTFEGNSSKNSALAIVSAEVASTLKFYGKNVTAYGLTDGIPEINCNNNTANCTGAQIVLSIGDCNCIKASRPIEIIGTEDFFKDFSKLKVIKGIIGMAVANKPN